MKTETAETRGLNMIGKPALQPDRDILTSNLRDWRHKLGYLSIFAAIPAILSPQAEARADDVLVAKPVAAGLTAPIAGVPKYGCSKPELLKRQSDFRLPHQPRGFDLATAFTGKDECPGFSIPGGNYTVAAPYIDTGDTTGANDTVTKFNYIYYCYYPGISAGPDHVYTFTVTGHGPNPRIEVIPTTSTYRPLIYIQKDTTGTSGCPAGTGNSPCRELRSSSAPSPGAGAAIGFNPGYFLPLNVPLYLFIDSAANNANGAGGYQLKIQDMTIAPARPPIRKFDFDGDGRSDLAVFRPSDRTWYLNGSETGISARPFGLASDQIVPGDYDGDGKTDIAIYRDGGWWRFRSSDNRIELNQFGLATDIPVPADYDGNGRDELAIYRDGVWWTFERFNSDKKTVVRFGLPTDKPVPGDYDGDGRSDQAVYRNGQWHLNRSSAGYTVIEFGLASDKPVPADYDGDSITDTAVYRDGTWYIRRSTGGGIAIRFGLATDVPVPGDYDGDGKADLAVYRNGTWYLLQSTSGVAIQQFGLTDDKPIPATYVR